MQLVYERSGRNGNSDAAVQYLMSVYLSPIHGLISTLVCLDHSTVEADSGPPGRSIKNRHVESFHCLPRDECLNASWSRTLDDGRSTLANRREEHNCERPHSSLGYWTPAKFRHALSYAEVETLRASRFCTASPAARCLQNSIRHLKTPTGTKDRALHGASHAEADFCSFAPGGSSSRGRIPSAN